MFQPKFQILLQKENFHDKFICLGSQLVEILNFIKKIYHLMYGMLLILIHLVKILLCIHPF